MTAPNYQTASAAGNSISAGVNIGWPSHQANDIGLMVIETSAIGGTLTPPSGWSAIPNTPIVDVASASGSKLHVWWKRAASSSEQAVNTGFSSSDHVLSRIFTFRGCITSGNPWDVTTTGTKIVASTTATVPALTTTVDEALIVMIVGRPDDSASLIHFGVPVNANLINISESTETGTALGDGGGFVLSYGTKTTPGDTGTSTLTKIASTTDTYVTLALRQPLRALTITASKATFTFSGKATQFPLTTKSASFSLAGRDVNINLNRVLNVNVSVFTFAWHSAQFPLHAFNGSFAFDNKNVNLLKASKLTIDQTIFSISGNPSSLVRTGNYTILGASSTYFTTENSANLLQSKKIQGDTNGYILSATNTALTHDSNIGYSLNCEGRNYTINGQAILLYRDGLLETTNTNFDIDRKNATVICQRLATISSLQYFLVGNNSSALVRREIGRAHV